jgi:hypothetical protein
MLRQWLLKKTIEICFPAPSRQQDLTPQGWHAASEAGTCA